MDTCKAQFCLTNAGIREILGTSQSYTSLRSMVLYIEGKVLLVHGYLALYIQFCVFQLYVNGGVSGPDSSHALQHFVHGID